MMKHRIGKKGVITACAIVLSLLLASCTAGDVTEEKTGGEQARTTIKVENEASDITSEKTTEEVPDAVQNEDPKDQPGSTNDDVQKDSIAGSPAYEAETGLNTDTITVEQKIVISEILSSNSKYMEHDGDFCDIIELANVSDEDVDLAEFYISDTLFNPMKAHLTGVIERGGMKVFFCVGEGADASRAELPFKISASGETVVLTDSTGNIVETVDVPKLQKNTSFARMEDGSFAVCENPTLGLANDAVIADMIVGSLSVSPEDGTRSEGPVEVTFTVLEGCDVFYTLDGSEPKTSSKKYTGDPIVLKKTTTVRTLTRLILTPQKSEITTLQNPDTDTPQDTVTTLQNSATTTPQDTVTTPQNSATTTPQDQDTLRNPGSGINSGTTSVEKTRLQSFSFFINEPDETLDDVCVGISVGDLSRLNASPHSSTRYPASIAMYRDGLKVFDETVGMNAHGNTSAVYDKKSYRIKFSKKFGESKLHYKLFDNLDIDSFDSFVLRGSSQDNEDIMLKDELVPEILRQGGIVDEVLTTSYRPVNLYLNGEYRGLYYIREHIDGPMIASHYGCNEEDVTIVEQCREIKCGSAGKEWTDLWDYVGSHDLTDPEAYAHVESLVSLESVADYYLIQIWLHNIDTDNLRVYKVGDDKWRYALYDLDLTLNDDGTNGPTFMLGRYNRGLYTFNALIFKLLKNPEFMELFLSRMQLLYTTILSEEKVLKVVDAFVEKIEHDMEHSCAVWGPRDDSSGGVYYINYSTWKRRVEKFKTRFAGRTSLVATEFVKLKGVGEELVRKYLADVIK